MITALTAAYAMATAVVPTQAPANRYALLIGIKDYSGIWKPLSGDKDVELLGKALATDQWGFKSENITTLKGRVTRKMILDSLAAIAAKAGPNDIVYIHYSGHGAQVDDITSPAHGLRQNQPNGRPDQALVPSDGKDFDPKTMVVADNLSAALAKFKTKNLTLTIDSCHSGGATRGSARPRGVLNPKYAAGSRGAGGQSRGAPASAWQGDLAGYTFISAARAEQLAWEVPDQGGIFTQSLLQAMAAARPGASFRELYDALYSNMMEKSDRMSEQQDPVLEGDPNRRVFGLDRVELPPYYSVRTANRQAQPELNVSAGLVHGIQVGTEISFFKAGTASVEQKENLLAKGIVKTVDVGASVVELTAEFKAKFTSLAGLAGSQAFVTAPSLGKGFLTLQVTAPTDKAEPILAALLKRPVLERATSARPADLSMSLEGGKWVVRSGSGVQVGEAPDDANAQARLEELAMRQARWRLLKDLGVSGLPSDIDVEFEAVPAETVPDPSGATFTLPKTQRKLPFVTFKSGLSTVTPAQKARQFTGNDFFAIKVRVTSRGGGMRTMDPYLALLCFEPTGEVEQMWPSPRARAEDLRNFRIPKDDGWYWLARPIGFIPVTETNPETLKNVFLYFVDAQEDSPGPQTWKMFATEEPVDFRPLLAPARGNSRGTLNPFQRLVAGFSDGTSRNALDPEPAKWATRSIVIEAVPGN